MKKKMLKRKLEKLEAKKRKRKMLKKKLDKLKTEQKKPIEELGKTGDVPFVIHSNPPEEMPQIPTHTHGLAEMGMPEFIMDPFAFGATQNAARINLAYDYFSKPENKNKLDAILNGKTVELTAKDLKPDATENYIYCFREVSPDFEAVKLAYPAGDNLGTNISDARIIQMYVKGDDYVLTDEYYKGGVMW